MDRSILGHAASLRRLAEGARRLLPRLGSWTFQATAKARAKASMVLELEAVGVSWKIPPSIDNHSRLGIYSLNQHASIY
jgi:hypothetical protein